MIKKVLITIVFSSLLLLVIMGCRDRQTVDGSISVIFFSYNLRPGETSNDFLTLYDLEEGDLIEKPDDPEREGFLFVGWYTDIGTTIPWDFENDRVSDHSFVLYARWTSLEWPINYILSGGVINDDSYPILHIAGQRTFVPINVRKEGFDFTGFRYYEWIYDEETGRVNTIPGDSKISYISITDPNITEIVVYAHWSPVSATVSFRIYNPLTQAIITGIGNKIIRYGQITDFVRHDNIGDWVHVGWVSNNSRIENNQLVGEYYQNFESDVDIAFTRSIATTARGLWKNAVTGELWIAP